MSWLPTPPIPRGALVVVVALAAVVVVSADGCSSRACVVVVVVVVDVVVVVGRSRGVNERGEEYTSKVSSMIPLLISVHEPALAAASRQDLLLLRGRANPR